MKNAGEEVKVVEIQMPETESESLTPTIVRRRTGKQSNCSDLLIRETGDNVLAASNHNEGFEAQKPHVQRDNGVQLTPKYLTGRLLIPYLKYGARLMQPVAEQWRIIYP